MHGANPLSVARQILVKKKSITSFYPTLISSGWYQANDGARKKRDKEDQARGKIRIYYFGALVRSE